MFTCAKIMFFYDISKCIREQFQQNLTSMANFAILIDLLFQERLINNLKTGRLRYNIPLQSLLADAAGILAYSETGSDD